MSDKTSFLQQWLEKVWYENGKGRFLLLPFTVIYCILNFIQRKVQTNKQAKITCPVIVVGNITVGGTGKTPLTIYITELLKKEGYKPAIITRGYGGNSQHWPQSVNAQTDPALVGDEAVLMATRTSVPVFVGANRLESIMQLLDKHDIDVIISDDGMQHYKMPRDIQIAVVDATRKFGNGYCLPAGPLREKKERLKNCDLIVLNGEGMIEQPSFTMKFSGNKLINLVTNDERDIDEFQSLKVIAVTGIGNPQRFYQSLENHGLDLKTVSFPDHHAFKYSDFDSNDNAPIIMTEKDAVKCKSFATNNMWYLPVTAHLDSFFDKELLSLYKHALIKST